MALLAYEEPETSPMFSLLSMDHRQSVADALNCAILGKREFLLNICLYFNDSVAILHHLPFQNEGWCTSGFYSDKVLMCSTCKPSKLHINGEIASTYYSCQAVSQPRTWEGIEQLQSPEICSLWSSI